MYSIASNQNKTPLIRPMMHLAHSLVNPSYCLLVSAVIHIPSQRSRIETIKTHSILPRHHSLSVCHFRCKRSLCSKHRCHTARSVACPFLTAQQLIKVHVGRRITILLGLALTSLICLLHLPKAKVAVGSRCRSALHHVCWYGPKQLHIIVVRLAIHAIPVVEHECRTGR